MSSYTCSWDDQNIEIWKMLLHIFRNICLYLFQYISDHPGLLYTLLYNIYHILYTRITFPNIQKCKLYRILKTFAITLFSMYSGGLYCVPRVFWRFSRSGNPLVTTPKFSEAQKYKFPYVLLLNCYIIIMINTEILQIKPNIVWGFSRSINWLVISPGWCNT